MTKARGEQVHVETTPYYHCMARCVRRAFLCGEDRFTGQNFDHRKQWIVDKLKALGGVFALDICAYAVMSNHYHVVLRVNSDLAKSWSVDEVIDRWYALFNGNLLVDRYRKGEALSKAERLAIDECVQTWRQRLMDISWLMRCLNESIAREANKEDGCKGRFWEGRFKSQALLDEAALLTCMMYVDLNPIRAGLCETPENADYTSIQERLLALAANRRTQKKQAKPKSSTNQLSAKQLPSKQLSSKQPSSPSPQPTSNYHPAELLHFNGNLKPKDNTGIPFGDQDYITLLDWTGRAVRDDKKGAIPAHIQPILQRLNINEEAWVGSIKHFDRRFYDFIGSAEKLKRAGEILGRHWLQGVSRCRQLYA